MDIIIRPFRRKYLILFVSFLFPRKEQHFLSIHFIWLFCNVKTNELWKQFWVHNFLLLIESN